MGFLLQGDRFGLPIPHPSDQVAFVRLAESAASPDVLVLDGPSSLIGDGDPFALSAGEFLVVALPGPDGAAEGYAAVKEIVAALPDAAVRVVVNRVSSQDEAREVFHRIAAATERWLGRTIRSYGGLPTLGLAGSRGAADDADGRTLLFSRIARAITARIPDDPPAPSYFEQAWALCSSGRG